MSTDATMVEVDPQMQAHNAACEQTKQQWKPPSIVSANNADALAAELTHLRVAHDELVKVNENYKNEMIELRSLVGELKRHAEEVDARRQRAPPPIETPTEQEQQAQANTIGGDVTR